MAPSPINVLLACLATWSACSMSPAQVGESQATVQPPTRSATTLADANLLPAHVAMLETAWQVVLQLPDVPHRKNRSRLQALLVEGCIARQQCKRAKDWADKISGWERGQCLAQLADACVSQGSIPLAEELLTEALKTADAVMEADAAQAWRRDRIRALVAAVRLRAGDSPRAEELAADLLEAEQGQLAAARVTQWTDAQLVEQLVGLEKLLASENVDQAKNALAMCVVLLGRPSGAAEQRERVLDMLLNGYPKLPLQMRLEVLLQAVDAAMQAKLPAVGLLLCDRCDQLVAGKGWIPEDQVVLRAKVAAARGKAGDREGASAAAAAAMRFYSDQRDQIPDVFRGNALRAIAEAHVLAGETAMAANCYQQALAEGEVNQNGRPRAEDLTRTVLSLVACGHVPDAALQARVTNIAKSITAPW